MGVPKIRVKSYLGDEVVGYGTGVILQPNLVLTAEHILNGSRHIVVLGGVEKSAVIEKKNQTAALLKILPESKQEEVSGQADNREGVAADERIKDTDRIKFTEEELLTEDVPWKVDGFITDEQTTHQMTGTGLLYTECPEQAADYKLKNIESGYAGNYQGLSGSPVICRNRIVGILQVQNFMERGLLGVEMSSINLFAELLPQEYLGASQYREAFEDRARSFAEKAIDNNIKSKKYIPDIFVEEGSYKENFRYYSEPELFLKKAVEEIASLNLGAVNQFLKGKDEPELSFEDIEEFASEHTTEDTCELLVKRLDSAIKKIERVREKAEKPGLSREKRYLKEEGGSYAILYTLERIRDEIGFFRYQIILITKDAGQGKTNFLCDFTRNFLLKKRIPVLFYNAYDFREPIINSIRKELTIDEAYSWEYVQRSLTRLWEKKHQAVVIVIDGLNENTALNDFGGYVSAFLMEIQKLPFLKVVLSTRNELLEERFGQLNSDSLGSSFYRMDMVYQSDKFQQRIFRGYLKYFDVEIMEGSLLNRTYKMLAEDTLLLRFFCEVNRGKRQVPMQHIYKYSLFQKYYEMKKKELVPNHSPGREAIFDKLIDHICRIMIDSRHFSEIPRNDLTEEELTVFDKLLEADVIFKQEMQKRTGLLQGVETVLGFTFDEFRDFCITRYILKNNDETTFPEVWKKMHAEDWSILEGVEHYLFSLSRTEGKAILPVLQKEPEYMQLYWKNIWELEETDITEKDIQMWKKEFLSGGVHAASIANFLMTHRDRNYFKKVNIELLFEMLNQLAENLSAFDTVTQDMFGKTQKNDYGRRNGKSASVISCDELTARLREKKNDIEFISSRKDALRLSVYMVEIDSVQISNMWIDVYSGVPDVVVEILELYVTREDLPRLIYRNIELILEAILKENGSDTKLGELKVALDKKLRQYDYSTVNKKLASIWEQ